MKLIPLTISAVLTIALVGCTPTPVVIVPDPAASRAPEISEEEVDARKDVRTSLEFGDVYTYTDDVSISVSTPGPFVPGQYAAGATQANNVAFNVTITNGSDEIMEPFPYTTVASGGVEGSAIFDIDQNVGGAPSTAILPGQTITWVEAWSISDPNSIALQIAPSFEYENAIFSNTF